METSTKPFLHLRLGDLEEGAGRLKESEELGLFVCLFVCLSVRFKIHVRSEGLGYVHWIKHTGY